MATTFHPRNMIVYLKANEIKRRSLEGLPKKLQDLNSGVKQKLSLNGIIRKAREVKRDHNGVNTYAPGPNYNKLMQRWTD